MSLIAPPGLAGVVVTDTAIGDVRGEEGYFHYRGHDATALARSEPLEAVWRLLLDVATDVASFADQVRQARLLDAQALAVLADLGAERGHGMEALRSAWSRVGAGGDAGRAWLDLTPAARTDAAVRLAAIGPVLAAALYRAAKGSPVREAELADLPTSTAAAYLTLLHGRQPSDMQRRALERYLVLTLDHGLNASTFVVRCVTSTGADLAGAVTAGLAALAGPLHGGAPSRALDMLDAIARPEEAGAWVESALDRGEKIMGFGHRIYRTEDPRARLLRQTATDLGGPRVELALEVERVVLDILQRRKPGRDLHVNVEYWAAVVLEAAGLPRELFTPTFAVSRVIGWTAHALEQTTDNRIVRPSSRYTGSAPHVWGDGQPVRRDPVAG